MHTRRLLRLIVWSQLLQLIGRAMYLLAPGLTNRRGGKTSEAVTRASAEPNFPRPGCAAEGGAHAYVCLLKCGVPCAKPGNSGYIVASSRDSCTRPDRTSRATGTVSDRDTSDFGSCYHGKGHGSDYGGTAWTHYNVFGWASGTRSWSVRLATQPRVSVALPWTDYVRCTIDRAGIPN